MRPAQPAPPRRDRRYESWGRYPIAPPRQVERVYWRHEPPDLARLAGTFLPFGRGRSYGDTCLNAGGVLLDTATLSRLISFDDRLGILRCEAGVTLADILEVIVGRGWFLPVTPGTKFVSVGGAIAHDVHGKNHHRAGTFGRHVTRFELIRSTGERLLCSPAENAGLFRATVGGLGLTGLILWAEFRLKPITTAFIDTERICFRDLDEFFAIAESSDLGFEYTVAWVDCMVRGRALGRGVFFRGNHSASAPGPLDRNRRPGGFRMPCDLPAWSLNPATVKAFNSVYFHLQSRAGASGVTHYDPFFYPLDRIGEWNRIYGPRGFLQYQCVVPHQDRGPIRRILERIADSGMGSFLAVLKTFGAQASPGMLSFPRPGVTLALDFPNNGERILGLLDELDEIVRTCGGAVYPAKDARMSARCFQSYFKAWREFSDFIDPKFSSSFWRRVSAGQAPDA